MGQKAHTYTYRSNVLADVVNITDGEIGVFKARKNAHVNQVVVGLVDPSGHKVNLQLCSVQVYGGMSV